MKLACSSSAYDAPLREGRIDLRGFVLACAADLDVDGVSIAAAHIPTTDAVYLRDLKKLCFDAHLTVASITVDSALASPERRDAEVERIKQWCDVAAYLGAPIVTLTAGSMPQPRPLDPGRIVGLFRRVFGEQPPNVRRAWSDVMWALRQCADYAAGYGLAVAVRNQRGALIDAPHQLSQSVRDVGSPWLRACPDPAVMRDRTAFDLPLQCAVEVAATIGDIRDDGSDAATHWPEILRLLRAARYRGFVTLDYAAATAAGAAPPDAALPRAARYMRGLLHLLARQEMLRSPNGDAAEPLPGDYRIVRPAADSDAELREILARR
jgi:sugar phosphate isomerase/epimerase